MSIASFRIHTEQELAQVCQLPNGRDITVHVPEQSIDIWVAEENTVGQAIVKSGKWVPSKSGMCILPTCLHTGTLTGYTSLGWALLDVTNVLACQYNNAQRSLLCDVYHPLSLTQNRTSGNGIQMSEAQSAVDHVNSRIVNQEMVGRLGEFLVEWQKLEQAIRYLMLKSVQGQRPIREIYKPDKSTLTNRTQEIVGQLDEELLSELQAIIPRRNAIIHGCVGGIGKAKSTIRPVVMHQDMAATALLSFEDPSNEYVMLAPTDKCISAEALTRIASQTRRLTKRVSQLSDEPNISKRYKESAPKPSSKGSNKRRRNKKKRR